MQRHPVDSFQKKLNFWEEFQDYKLHPIFGEIWKLNKKTKLEKSSLFMWALTLCYDRKSSFFPQPEIEKWEVVCEDLLDDSKVFINLATSEDEDKYIVLPINTPFSYIVQKFEETIDTPLGISLRLLEKKLAERTEFIRDTKYTVDRYKEVKGKNILIKGTADQLDRMFANTKKITDLIQEAINALQSSTGVSKNKGGGEASLSDGDSNF